MVRCGSHSNYTNACIYLVSVTWWRLHRLRGWTSNCSLLLIYLPQKDERLSRPGWLTYSGWFSHISGHPSAASRAQYGKFAGQRLTSITMPRNQFVGLNDGQRKTKPKMQCSKMRQRPIHVQTANWPSRLFYCVRLHVTDLPTNDQPTNQSVTSLHCMLQYLCVLV